MTSPIDDIYGAEPRRFLRLVYEFEIEVTDPIQAAAYTMDFTRDEAGEPAMMQHPNQNRQMADTVSQVLAKALMDNGPKSGFQWLSADAARPRLVGEDGRYTEMTLPSRTARPEDDQPDQ